MKKQLLLSILLLFHFSGIVSAQTTGTFIVADKTTRMESCIDSTVTLAQIIEYTGIRDLNDPDDNASKYKMFRLEGALITTDELTTIKYSDYTQVFVKKMNDVGDGNHYGLPIFLQVTSPPTFLFKKDTLKFTVEKGAKVFYINDFFNEFVLFSSGKDVQDLNERIFIRDQSTGIETSWKNTPEIWSVGKGNYRLRAKVSVCTEQDYYYDSIFVIVTETPCLTLQVKNLPPVCKDETFDITPYIYIDDHIASSTELSDITFRNKSAIIPPSQIPLLNPTAINMTELVNKTTLFPRIEMLYAPNVALGVCASYTYTPPTKVPNTFPQTNVVFTYDNDGRQRVYELEDQYYSFNNTFNKTIFKKTYIDNYDVHTGTTINVFTDAAYQSPVTGNNLTEGTYYVLATNADCNNDSVAFTAVVKERDFDIIWQAAPNMGQGYYTFDAPVYTGATYAWFAWSGSIVAGLGTNHITVYFSDNAAGSPFVSCNITLNNVRTTGAPAVLGSAVYLMTNNDGIKEEITEENIATGTLSPETIHNIYAYPNPAAETFALSGEGVSDVKVYSTLGQLVYSNSFYAAGSPISIQSKGLHVVHIRQQGNLQTLKIVLQ